MELKKKKIESEATNSDDFFDFDEKYNNYM